MDIVSEAHFEIQILSQCQDFSAPVRRLKNCIKEIEVLTIFVKI